MTMTEPTTEPIATEGHTETTPSTEATPSKVAGKPAAKRFSISDVAKRIWVALVIAAVVAVAGFAVYRLRGVFGVHGEAGTSTSGPDEIVPFNPKHVVYEVFGEPGAVATINYLDVSAEPQQVLNTPLPWTLSVTTTLPSVSVNIVAQSDGDFIGCRIIVNDVVKDERSINEVNAQTFCLVKSA